MKYSTFFISSLIGLAWIGGFGFYLSAYREEQAYVIRASQEPELAHPVYAQFVYTQLIEAQDIHRVSKIILPVHIRPNAQQFTVRLLRNGNVIQEWLVTPEAEGVQDFEFTLDKPALVDGQLAVQVDAGAISHDAKASAPGVFIETADDAFPYGYYQIAQNDKKGDISLQLYEEKTRWQLFREILSTSDRFTLLARSSMWLAFVLLTLHVPFMFRNINTQ